MDTGQFLRGLAILIAAIALVGWVLVRWLKTTRETPARLVVKWILTVLVCVFVLAPLGANLTTNGQGGAFLMPFVAAGGLLLAIIWTPTVVNWFASKFESVFTGGDTAPDPEPFYSVAQARRKQGKYREAIGAIQGELQKFPHDVTGHMMLAEIHALDLRDLEAARIVIERFCAQPGHAPHNVAMALTSLADWHLKIDRDTESARQTLQRIQDLLPDSEQSIVAAQRLAHMGNDEFRQSHFESRPVALRAGADKVGLMQDSSSLRRAEEDPEVTVARLLDQLEDHPLDWEAREKLAVLYAGHYRDLGLATDQLETLMAQTAQPVRNIVRWLNLLADFQIAAGETEETVRATLERVIALNPAAAAAERSRQRQAYLKLDLKGQQKGRVVRLGTYEQNIGLKGTSEPPASLE